MARQGAQIVVAESIADRRRLLEDAGAGLKIAGHDPFDRAWQQQVSSLHAVELTFVEQPSRPRDPAAARCRLASIDEHHGLPGRAANGPFDLIVGEQLLVGASPQLFAVFIAASEIGGHGGTLEVLSAERLDAIRGGQLCGRSRPRPPFECLAAINKQRPNRWDDGIAGWLRPRYNPTVRLMVDPLRPHARSHSTIDADTTSALHKLSRARIREF